MTTFDFGAPIVSDELSRRCASVLASSARSRGLSPSVSGALVGFTHGAVALRARVEARQSGAGRQVVSVAVDTIVGNHPAMTVGSVGIGRDEPDAVETAIQEWGALVAPAVIGAVELGERAGERYAVDGYIAYPGATGFRGAAPAWGAAEHRRLLASLRRALPLPVAGTLRPLTLTVMVEPGQMPQGEVRFDGIVVPSLWPSVQLFDWPQSASGYIFKQFYILTSE